MTTSNKGDIVLVPFPFSEQTTTKKHPAAIISADKEIVSFLKNEY